MNQSIEDLGSKAIAILYDFAPLWFVVGSIGLAMILYAFGVRSI